MLVDISISKVNDKTRRAEDNYKSQESIMGRNLPNLNSIRAFEAVARHLSFTRASEELNVTQAAVSHQIKGLEAQLGVMLFRRHNKGLLLTKEGQAMLQPMTNAFDLIADATNLIFNSEIQILKVSMLSSFATGWLMPRLDKFYAEYPNIDIRVMVTNKDFDLLKAGDVDIDLRYGDGKWPHVESQKFLPEEIFPVCSPDLLKGGLPLKTLDDLGRHILLHDNKVIGWKEWLDDAGIKGVDYNRGPGFSHYQITLQAATLGHGIALGRTPLVLEALKKGDLVRPFDISLPTGMGYYIINTNTATDKTKIRAFTNWLMNEVKLFEQGE
ncbi:Glycine cleavage system transcriptional activator GcvA [hydrothermal vent metagenome]|uniref:Glycine cleavage system transcriptional activator GcvA n=1 Tax=hydrothermal vent metagenome TaxID=652676 RepID=A0A3B1B9Y9_9ZZZZ